MNQPAPSQTAFRVAELSQNSPTAFKIRPETAKLQELSAQLDLLGLRKLSFSGEIEATGDRDWKLTGKLGATVIQPCAVTLEPVTTRIDTSVRRLFQSDMQPINAPEAEIPDDVEIEALATWIDPEAVMLEALDLALPLYPRAEGAELGEIVVTEPGVKPMRDEDARPFAGLAGLKEKLAQQADEDD